MDPINFTIYQINAEQAISNYRNMLISYISELDKIIKNWKHGYPLDSAIIEKFPIWNTIIAYTKNKSSKESARIDKLLIDTISGLYSIYCGQDTELPENVIEVEFDNIRINYLKYYRILHPWVQ